MASRLFRSQETFAFQYVLPTLSDIELDDRGPHQLGRAHDGLRVRVEQRFLSLQHSQSSDADQPSSEPAADGGGA